MLDAFHVVELGTDAVDRCRRRIEQDIHDHRGRRSDPLHGTRNTLRASAEDLTDRQWARLHAAFAADGRHLAVWLAWSCAQQLRSAYRHERTAEGRKNAGKVIDSSPTCPVPENARLGRTLKQCAEAFLAYFDTSRASNGGTEAVNGLTELHRRIGRGLRNRDSFRVRRLLSDGGLSSPPPRGRRADGGHRLLRPRTAGARLGRHRRGQYAGHVPGLSGTTTDL